MGACGWVCEYALAVPADARSARHVAVERADHSEHDSNATRRLASGRRRVRPRLFSPPPRWTRKRFPDSTGGARFCWAKRPPTFRRARLRVRRRPPESRCGAAGTSIRRRFRYCFVRCDCCRPMCRSNCTSWATVRQPRGGGHWRKRSGSIIDAIFTVGGRAMRQLPSCNRSTPSPSQASRTQPRVSSSRPWAPRCPSSVMRVAVFRMRLLANVPF